MAPALSAAGRLRQPPRAVTASPPPSAGPTDSTAPPLAARSVVTGSGGENVGAGVGFGLAAAAGAAGLAGATAAAVPRGRGFAGTAGAAVDVVAGAALALAAWLACSKMKWWGILALPGHVNTCWTDM